MKVDRALTIVALSVVAGCAYHNVLYNSERLFEEAEAHRREGRENEARARYRDVVRKTGEALRNRPGSDWASDALFLMGRSRLRLGELREARAALHEAADRRSRTSQDEDAFVYLAEVEAALGDDAEALDLVTRALDGSLGEEARAAAHLLRGRLLLSRALTDQGWQDLDRAIEYDGGTVVEAGLERLRWAIRFDDRTRATYALSLLLGQPEAAIHVDSIVSLTHAAASRWGPAAAAELLVDVERATWERTARGRMALERARQLSDAGEEGSAIREAARVAAGLGPSAAEARLLLSDWQLVRAVDLAEVYAVRALLLPAGSDSTVAARLEDLAALESFTNAGLDDPLGWFAAAEIARDRLGADYVARGLFLAYADAAPGEAWAPKALLAAIDVSAEVGDRAWLRGRLEAYDESPYVLAARGRPAAGYLELEEELDVRLRTLVRQ